MSCTKMSMITCFLGRLLSWGFLFSLFSTPIWSAGRRIANIPSMTHLVDLFPRTTFDDGFLKLFGANNVEVSSDRAGVSIMLDKHSGSGFVSKGKYHYGFFSTKMKLPSGYSAGVVVAFYMSNSDAYPHNHDEIDFELLGHDNRREWVMQTNLYGDGSVSTGREEKFRLWFDPTKEFHSYTILWNSHHIVYLVDGIPVREVINNGKSSKVYPSKPMSIYATIWDGSDWATHGGKKPVNYKYAPFIASFREMQIAGCLQSNNATSPLCSTSKDKDGTDASVNPVEGQEFITLSTQQKAALRWARKKFMTYSYCKDRRRYHVLLPECN